MGGLEPVMGMGTRNEMSEVPMDHGRSGLSISESPQSRQRPSGNSDMDRRPVPMPFPMTQVTQVISMKDHRFVKRSSHSISNRLQNSDCQAVLT